MLRDPDFVPFEPPPEPLCGLTAPRTLWRNYIEAFPRSTYQNGITYFSGRVADVLYVTDPDVIEDVLVRRPEAFGRDPTTHRAFDPLIGPTSLFMAQGAEWRWQRRAVAPAFRHETLLSFVPIFDAMTERQIERWRQAPHGVPVAVDQAMTHMTFDVIVEAMLGGTTKFDIPRYTEALKAGYNTIPWHMLLQLFSVPEWVPFPGKFRAQAARKFLHADVGRIVAERKRAPSSRPDLLDLLINARDGETGRGMTDKELVANLLTFITAGHETTAVALTWTLWLLAKDEASQDRLRAEVRTVVGDGPVQAEHLDRLAFTRQVLQESMRLFPPAVVISRQAKANMEVGGVKITPRTRVTIPIFALHRHEALWDDPTSFDPDRFSPERSKSRPRFAYLPFGAGPRICIGASLAMLEAATIVALLVRAFRFAPVPGFKPFPVVRLTLRPRDGMRLMIEPL